MSGRKCRGRERETKKADLLVFSSSSSLSLYILNRIWRFPSSFVLACQKCKGNEREKGRNENDKKPNVKDKKLWAAVSLGNRKERK